MGEPLADSVERLTRRYLEALSTDERLQRRIRRVEQRDVALERYGHAPDQPLTVLLKDDTACIRCGLCALRCPTEAMTFVIRPTDYPAQGPGHLGRQYRRERVNARSPDAQSEDAA